jgi:hypothetical protein
MASVVHSIFASRPGGTTTGCGFVRVAWRKEPVKWALACISSCFNALEDCIRFTFIVCFTVPLLAWFFIMAGILLHIPRILAAYACKIVMLCCIWHVKRKRIPPYRDASPHSRCKGMLGCCCTCRLYVYMSGGTFRWSGLATCCTCNHRIVS